MITPDTHTGAPPCAGSPQRAIPTVPRAAGTNSQRKRYAGVGARISVLLRTMTGGVSAVEAGRFILAALLFATAAYAGFWLLFRAVVYRIILPFAEVLL